MRSEEKEKQVTLPSRFAPSLDKLAAIYDVTEKRDVVTFMTKDIESVWSSLQALGCRISDIEIQNKTSPGYHLVTRSIAYSSRMISSQWGREYDSEDYDGMKKVYSFWIVPQASKSKDGCINQLKIAENHLSGNYQEKRESYDKEEQLMIYLSKGHSPNDKYESYDEILMPIGALLNNTLNYQEKNKVIKEYSLDDEEFEERMRDMCNLGEALELEAIESERVRNIRNIIDEFHCSLEKAMDILKLTEKERQEIMPYFQA